MVVATKVSDRVAAVDTVNEGVHAGAIGELRPPDGPHHVHVTGETAR